MTVSLLLEMATELDPGRVCLVDGDVRMTTAELGALASRGAGVLVASPGKHVVYVGTGGAHLPLLAFSSARAGLPFTPLNYRLSESGLRQLIDRLDDPVLVVDGEYRGSLEGAGKALLTVDEFVTAAGTAEPVHVEVDPDSTAIVLFTSGTTSTPKAVELSHNNLTSYVMNTVEFASAEVGDAVLVCVPPYHIAGVGAALSNLYAGRKMVYLRRFDARSWIDLVNSESVTNSTVVPTMLARIVAALEDEPTALPSLRNLAYGGSKVPLPLIRRALDLLPAVGFVNAYGLTETSSTLAVLTPDDHRVALHATDSTVAKRLASVGRPVPSIAVEIRSADGVVLPPGQTGELFVRGEQVSGKYTGLGSALDEAGWFPTKDVATLDDEGYLYIGGRSDDTIIRGGENIAPAELEDVIVEHPDVREVAVVGLDDPVWGQIIVAAVVPQHDRVDGDAICEFVRDRLRSSRAPDRVVFLNELPATPTGKILRRSIVEDLKAK